MELTPPTIRDGPVRDSAFPTKEGRPQSEEEGLVSAFGFIPSAGTRGVAQTRNRLRRPAISCLSPIRWIRTFYLTTVRLVAAVLTVDDAVAARVLLQKAAATLTLVPYGRAGCFWEAERTASLPKVKGQTGCRCRRSNPGCS